jgi:hypothetical protein
LLAELLAGALGIAPESCAAFVRFARDATSDGEISLLIPAVSVNPSPVSSSVLSKLPTPATAIIGRETELVEVGDLLRRSETRLVTLTGPGGTGKTRLALQVAAGMRDTFRDGPCLVSLAPITDPNLVAPTIAQTLDVRETGGRSVLENLRRYLRSKRMLLLLDNFEQVAAAGHRG